MVNQYSYFPFIISSQYNILLLTIMRTIRLLFTFYKSFAFASLIITLSCLITTYIWGIQTFAAMLFLKIFTLCVIFFYIRSFKKNEFYYYKNLGLTQKHLWIPTFTFEVFLFLILTSLKLNIR